MTETSSRQGWGRRLAQRREQQQPDRPPRRPRLRVTVPAGLTGKPPSSTLGAALQREAAAAFAGRRSGARVRTGVVAPEPSGHLSAALKARGLHPRWSRVAGRMYELTLPEGEIGELDAIVASNRKGSSS